MTSKVTEKLKDPEYRKAFVASQINVGIPFQIRALLKSRGRTQEWLAKETGMLQPRISGLMTPGRTRPNIETLRRLAEAFDCGLAVRFVPFSELARWSSSFDPESFSVPEYKKDGFDDSPNEAIPAVTGPLQVPQVASLPNMFFRAPSKVMSVDQQTVGHQGKLADVILIDEYKIDHTYKAKQLPIVDQVDTLMYNAKPKALGL
jgi:transcriptional regulator with XRE-family HTH domain